MFSIVWSNNASGMMSSLLLRAKVGVANLIKIQLFEMQVLGINFEAASAKIRFISNQFITKGQIVDFVE